MAATLFTDTAYKSNQRWSKVGPPTKVFNTSGPFGKTIVKNVEADVNGDGFILVPVDSRLGGTPGAAYQRVSALSASSGGVRYTIPIKEHWSKFKMSWFAQKLSERGGMRGGQNAVDQEMEAKALGFYKKLSYNLWGKGDGLISKGDGQYTISGNVITLQNSQTANRFEVDDVLIFAAARPAPGSLATPRTGTVKIASINESNGTLTTVEADISAAIAGATNADYIGHKVDFPDLGDESNLGPIAGVPLYVPETSTEANLSLFGVTRSDHVDRLSGRRVALSGNESPYEVVTRMLQEAVNAGAPVNVIYHPLEQSAELMREMKAEEVLYTKTDTKQDRKHLQMGVSAISAMFPGHDREVMLIGDKYLCDIELTKSDDRTFYGLQADGWALQSVGNIEWVAMSTEGKIQQLSDSQTTVAAYGAFMQLIPDAPGYNVVASTRAAL